MRRLLLVGLALLGLMLTTSVAGTPAGFSASSVNTLTGNYSYDRVDAAGIVDGVQVPFLRTYNSTDSRYTSLGQGWTHNFAVHLARPSVDSSDILLVGPQGRTDAYAANPNSNSFTPRQDLAILSLEYLPAEGAYVARMEDGTVYRFDQVGQLTEIAEPGKPRLTVEQGPHGVQQVLGPEGQPVLRFGYSSQTGRLVSITDVPDPSQALTTPRVVQYGYDQQGRLESVTNRVNQTTHFAYYGDGYQLQSIVDANGHAAIALTYDGQGRVVARYDARGVQTQRARLMRYSTQADGTQTTVETLVPSGWDPSFTPTITSGYTDNKLISETTQPGPGDDPLIETWTWGADPTRAVASLHSGGATAPVAGAPAQVPAGVPGAAAVRVGNPDDPLPTPVCVPSPPIGATPRATLAWSTGSEKADPREFLAQTLAQSIAGATDPLFDGFHRLIGFRDGVGGQWQLDYNAEGELVDIIGPSGEVATIAYDAVGNVVSIQQAAGLDTFTYDDRDSLAQAHWANGTQAQYEYDDRGDLVRAAVDRGPGSSQQVAEYAFDGLHRLRRVTRYIAWPNTAPTLRTELMYDAAGTCSAVLD